MMTTMDDTTQARVRWFHLTPGRFVIGLLVVEVLLWLSARFGWLGWHKGHAVLTCVTVVGVAMLVMLLWFAFGLLFRWRFQFSIRLLLVLAVAVALPCSWLAVEMRKAKKQKEVLDTVVTTVDVQAIADILNPLPKETQDAAAKVMVSVKYDFELDAFGDTIPRAKPPGPAWLSNVLGDDFFAEVVSIQVDSMQLTPATDSLLEHLKGLRQLRVLGLKFTEVTDAGLVNLEGLSQLECLELEETKVTDAGLASLEGLTQLFALNLRDTQVADAGLAHLTRLPSLQCLILDGTQVTDVGLEHLERLGQLKYLSLRGTGVTDKGMKKLLQALPNCDIDR